MLNFMRKRGLLALLFLVLCDLDGGLSCLTAQTSESDTLQISGSRIPVVKKNSPRGAVIRSAVFPGWGQWYNGKKFKALVVLGTEVGFVSAAIWHNQRVVYWMDSALMQYTAEYRELNKSFHIDMRNQFVWYLAGALLVSMADAYVDAHLADFDESPNLSFVPYANPGGRLSKGFMFCFRKSF